MYCQYNNLFPTTSSHYSGASSCATGITQPLTQGDHDTNNANSLHTCTILEIIVCKHRRCACLSYTPTCIALAHVCKVGLLRGLPRGKRWLCDRLGAKYMFTLLSDPSRCTESMHPNPYWMLYMCTPRSHPLIAMMFGLGYGLGFSSGWYLVVPGVYRYTTTTAGVVYWIIAVHTCFFRKKPY